MDSADKLLKAALKYVGMKEVPGTKSNKSILKWIREYVPNAIDDSEVAWCSIFMNEIAKECGLEYTDKTLARSWLKVGYEVFTPQIGDVVIFWRKQLDSRWGHVGLYISEDDKYIYVLGGNQSNAVNIKPYLKSRLLGYRKLRKDNGV